MDLVVYPRVHSILTRWFNKMLPAANLLFTAMCILTFICLTKSDIRDCNILKRTKRQLLFPNSTLLQFNAGIGTPTPIKTINFNWAFQANFQLPWNRTQIPLDILEANAGYTGLSRRKREIGDSTSSSSFKEDYENDAKLYHFYKYVEDVLNSFGHNGTSCVLKALCHLGAEPLHEGDGEDLLHELANFILNPENDHTEEEPVTKESLIYIKAFKSGDTVEHCINNYNCSLSLVEMFTKIKDTFITSVSPMTTMINRPSNQLLQSVDRLIKFKQFKPTVNV